jgi:hypothetical protein
VCVPATHGRPALVFAPVAQLPAMD